MFTLLLDENGTVAFQSSHYFIEKIIIRILNRPFVLKMVKMRKSANMINIFVRGADEQFCWDISSTKLS